MTAFYNEIDPFAAQWLRNLIATGHIAPGIVDERPIQEIEPWELVGFTQCHFFAGIGVWSHALRRAGWSDDRPIWTGSCPCQPFSNAGKKKGFSDERHLWPHWGRLIDERKPSVFVGEQVASALEWIDLVSFDVERSGYAIGASDLCAAGFDGAHIRQRNYFVGVHDSTSARRDGSLADTEGNTRDQARLRLPDVGRESGGMAHHHHPRSQGRQQSGRECSTEFAARSGSVASGLADDDEQGSSGRRVQGSQQGVGASAGTVCERSSGLCQDRVADAPMLGRTPVDWLYCRDGKWRPVEPGTFPLVDAAPARVGRLRAYGNALDAETATEFCRVVKEICDEIGV